MRSDGCKLLPSPDHVTKTGAYGNETPVFFGLNFLSPPRNPLFSKGREKLAQVLLYVWYKNNNKQC